MAFQMISHLNSDQVDTKLARTELQQQILPACSLSPVNINVNFKTIIFWWSQFVCSTKSAKSRFPNLLQSEWPSWWPLLASSSRYCHLGRSCTILTMAAPGRVKKKRVLASLWVCHGVHKWFGNNAKRWDLCAHVNWQLWVLLFPDSSTSVPEHL